MQNFDNTALQSIRGTSAADKMKAKIGDMLLLDILLPHPFSYHHLVGTYNFPIHLWLVNMKVNIIQSTFKRKGTGNLKK